MAQLVRSLIGRLMQRAHDRWCPCEDEWQDYCEREAERRLASELE